MLLITAVVALPILRLLIATERLQWWHALTAGVVCSLAGAYVEIGFFRSGPNEVHWPTMYLPILAGSCAASIVFWWTGIFPNGALPFVSRRIPFEMIVVVPLFLLGQRYYEAVAPQSTYGCIISKEKAANPTAWRFNRVGVKLKSGETVYTSQTKGYSEIGEIGQCTRVSRRRTLLLSGYVYGTYMSDTPDCVLDCIVPDQ